MMNIQLFFVCGFGDTTSLAFIPISMSSYSTLCKPIGSIIIIVPAFPIMVATSGHISGISLPLFTAWFSTEIVFSHEALMFFNRFVACFASEFNLWNVLNMILSSWTIFDSPLLFTKLAAESRSYASRKSSDYGFFAPAAFDCLFGNSRFISAN